MPAGQITVKVVRDGRVLKEIERPLHVEDGQRSVVFRRKRWLLKLGNRIVIDEPPLRSKNDARAEAFGAGGGAEQSKRIPRTAPKITATRSRRIGDVSKKDYAELDAKPALGVRDSGQTSAYTVEVGIGESVAPVPDTWDTKQLAVIAAPQDARLLVDAGPGTGKTAVACRRVAWLIDECGVTPANVWLVSFTRTAVKEIRNRIRHYLKDPADVFSVKVATIDAHAWAIHSGFDSSASLSGSYDENIERVMQLVRENDGVFEYLEGVEHLIVDEAQDIVGLRADLMMEVLRKLDAGCGVTVFADEAQAIYGFANDDDDNSTTPEGHLPARLRSHRELKFRETALLAIYRTNRQHLVKLFTEVRARVLAPAEDGDNDRLERVHDMVRALADGEEAVIEALDPQDHEALRGTFVLYRRRIDALTAASFWGTAPHRLRMSGMPVLVEPWLGAMLWDHTEKKLKQSAFERLWADRVEARDLTGLTADRAWELLVKTAGESRTLVSTLTLRARLGRSAPPSDFTRGDFGLGGPVFGTIHGCKGREADSVLLMLPASVRPNSDEDEEARVVFVGATRARAELRIGKGFQFLKSRKLGGSGRVYALKTGRGKAAAQVEFGRAGDLSAEGVAGRGLFNSADGVEAAQCWLAGNAGRIVPASARAVAELDWRYRVVPEGGPSVAFFSDRMKGELFSVGDEVKKGLGWNRKLRPSGGPDHLKIFGACTFVLHPDDPCRDRLHEPFASSGFMLAPVVQGFDMIYFRY